MTKGNPMNDFTLNHSRIRDHLKSVFSFSLIDDILKLAYKVGDAQFYQSKQLDPVDEKLIQDFLAEHTKLLKEPSVDSSYFNAQRLYFKALEHPILKSRIQYCEGYCVHHYHPMLLAHAWLVFDDHTVIDVSLPPRPKQSKTEPWQSIDTMHIYPKDQILGQIPMGSEYFGLCVDIHHLEKKLKDHQSIQPILELLMNPQGNFDLFKKYIRLLGTKNKKK